MLNCWISIMLKLHWIMFQNKRNNIIWNYFLRWWKYPKHLMFVSSILLKQHRQVETLGSIWNCVSSKVAFLTVHGTSLAEFLCITLMVSLPVICCVVVFLRCECNCISMTWVTTTSRAALSMLWCQGLHCHAWRWCSSCKGIPLNLKNHICYRNRQFTFFRDLNCFSSKMRSQKSEAVILDVILVSCPQRQSRWDWILWNFMWSISDVRFES